MTNRKPDYKDSDLGVNLYEVHLFVPVARAISANAFSPVEDRESGSSVLLPAMHFVEQEKSVRVFVNSDKRKVICGLSDRACKLFLWIGYSLKPGDKSVWVNKKLAAKDCGFRDTRVVNGLLGDLHKANIICPTAVDGVYWINPSIFFNGNRIKHFPAAVKVVHDIQETIK